MPCRCYYFNHRDSAEMIASVFGTMLHYPRLTTTPLLENNRWRCPIYGVNGIEEEEIVDTNHSLVCFVHDTGKLTRWRNLAVNHRDYMLVVFVSQGARIQQEPNDSPNVKVWDEALNVEQLQEYVTRLCAGGGR